MILLTGSNGFLGKIILESYKNAEVDTLSRSNASINSDLSKDVPVINTAYDIVIHAAGKAHSVPKTEEEKKAFFDVNTKGTQNLLKALEQSRMLPKAFVFISTVAVYGKDTGNLINENEPLAAKDAYGLSKIEAEKIVRSWCQQHNVVCSILRLPLLVGPNPPGNLKSMINGIKKGFFFNIGQAEAKKSMVLASDVGVAIKNVAMLGGTYNLTDGYNPSFKELSLYIAQKLGKPAPKHIPGWLAGLMAKVGDMLGERAPINSAKQKKITSDLTFDDAKARSSFNWNPCPVLKGFEIQ